MRWKPTERGWDALPILFSYNEFGMKRLASDVFTDGKPPEMREICPQKNLQNMFVNLDVDRASIRKLQSKIQAPKTSWSA